MLWPRFCGSCVLCFLLLPLGPFSVVVGVDPGYSGVVFGDLGWFSPSSFDFGAARGRNPRLTGDFRSSGTFDLDRWIGSDPTIDLPGFRAEAVDGMNKSYIAGRNVCGGEEFVGFNIINLTLILFKAIQPSKSETILNGPKFSFQDSGVANELVKANQEPIFLAADEASDNSHRDSAAASAISIESHPTIFSGFPLDVIRAGESMITSHGRSRAKSCAASIPAKEWRRKQSSRDNRTSEEIIYREVLKYPAKDVNDGFVLNATDIVGRIIRKLPVPTIKITEKLVSHGKPKEMANAFKDLSPPNNEASVPVTIGGDNVANKAVVIDDDVIVMMVNERAEAGNPNIFPEPGDEFFNVIAYASKELASLPEVGGNGSNDRVSKGRGQGHEPDAYQSGVNLRSRFHVDISLNVEGKVINKEEMGNGKASTGQVEWCEGMADRAIKLDLHGGRRDAVENKLSRSWGEMGITEGALDEVLDLRDENKNGAIEVRENLVGGAALVETSMESTKSSHKVLFLLKNRTKDVTIPYYSSFSKITDDIIKGKREVLVIIDHTIKIFVIKPAREISKLAMIGSVGGNRDEEERPMIGLHKKNVVKSGPWRNGGIKITHDDPRSGDMLREGSQIRLEMLALRVIRASVSKSDKDGIVIGFGANSTVNKLEMTEEDVNMNIIMPIYPNSTRDAKGFNSEGIRKIKEDVDFHLGFERVGRNGGNRRRGWRGGRKLVVVRILMGLKFWADIFKKEKLSFSLAGRENRPPFPAPIATAGHRSRSKKIPSVFSLFDDGLEGSDGRGFLGKFLSFLFFQYLTALSGCLSLVSGFLVDVRISLFVLAPRFSSILPPRLLFSCLVVAFYSHHSARIGPVQRGKLRRGIMAMAGLNIWKWRRRQCRRGAAGTHWKRRLGS
ncbi:hypothetical protein F3Y22_tig00003715pilonHSYRG00105 [Hibiscus syriacus]|uniref:Uncharacterized protein n=1 Tax=Hibiscus syriacus TaxID=106335 RepID=A0A6A3CQK5_HIBSY|nr:hypothetical protein F3Y22_tig00003715pilonHSYRG00105 [Hibiscus syriacus]